MVDCRYQNKSDAAILADIKAKSANVEGFAWDAGEPKVSFTSMPTSSDEAKVGGYFDRLDYKEWVDVTV